MVPINRTETGAMERANQCLINKMTFSESSPEKAGVGGSIPSLATIIPKDFGDFADFLQPTIQPTILIGWSRLANEPCLRAALPGTYPGPQVLNPCSGQLSVVFTENIVKIADQ